jgi:hypothetical protein
MILPATSLEIRDIPGPPTVAATLRRTLLDEAKPFRETTLGRSRRREQDRQVPKGGIYQAIVAKSARGLLGPLVDPALEAVEVDLESFARVGDR